MTVSSNVRTSLGIHSFHLQGQMRYTARLLPKRRQVAEIIVEWANLTAVYPRDLGEPWVKLSRFWGWLWLWHASSIVCASSHIHWCVDCSEDHESVLGVFAV